MQNISSEIVLLVITAYFAVLVLISYLTSKNSNNATFFTADKSSSWVLVAIGMIGASLSGVTFISIPGVVGKESGTNINFSYMQMVFGYLVGYAVIAMVLMPLYYRHNLTSIYSYLHDRLGVNSYKTAAGFFLLSRIIGASFRLYLVSMVMDVFITGPMGVPLPLTILITIVLIWLYTHRGGIKTIVFTDTIQTVAMISAVILTLIAILHALDAQISDVPALLSQKGYSKMFYFESWWSDPNSFYKQFFSGALIALVMTGLDQDMMQKNLTCRSLQDAQKNIFLFSIVLVFANLIFLALGGMLYIYAEHLGVAIPDKTDQLYPLLALNHLPQYIGIAFVIGLIAAAYSSADSALTSLTTSFSVDFLHLDKLEHHKEAERKRKWVHIGFSAILFIVILLYTLLNNDSVINNLFRAASYTYGPILGLFAFSILTHYRIKDRYVLVVCLAAPILTYIIDANSVEWFNGLSLGYLTLLLNGVLTALGLRLISK